MSSRQPSIHQGPVTLSIAIVSYNTRTILLNCIHSIYETTGDLSLEIIVVDNGSRDGSPEAVQASFPGARVIANRDNRGFAKAVNQALAASSGRYFLLLNSDTIMGEGALARMVAHLDAHAETGGLGCLQKTAEGRRIRSAFAFPGLREHVLNIRFFRALAPGAVGKEASPGGDPRAPREVDWVNGACLMVRTDVLRTLGGLDERYFMYFEDVDLCLRLKRLGYRVTYLPEAQIVHLVGRSSEGNAHDLNLQWEYSRITFVETHFPLWRRVPMKAWIVAGGLLRILHLLVAPKVSGERSALIRNNLRTIRRAFANIP